MGGGGHLLAFHAAGFVAIGSGNFVTTLSPLPSVFVKNTARRIPWYPINLRKLLVPGVGLEPTRPYGQGILSPQ